MTGADCVVVRGVPIAVVDRREAAERVAVWVAGRAQAYVACASVHLVETAAATPEVAGALRAADLVLADGAPVSWAARVLGRRAVPRVTGSDLFAEVLGSRPYRHYFYGTTPAVLARLVDRVSDRYPHAIVCGTHAPPFRQLTATEEDRIASEIDAANPDIVWVGLGAPRQELWMQRMRPRIDAPVLIAVGAVFDFVSGEKRRAPRWMRAIGIEWLFRLGREPRRLLSRYAKTNTSFVVGVVRSLLHHDRRGLS